MFVSIPSLMTARKGIAAGGQVFLLNQNFETPTTGYDNGETWTENGTVNPAYTGVVLRGTQSLRLSSSGASISHTFTGSSDVSFFCDFKLIGMPTVGDGQVTMGLNPLNAGTGVQLACLVDNSGNVKLFSSSGSSANSATTLSTGTLYHCWMEFINGGTGVLAISTTLTKPTVDGGGNVYLTATCGAFNADKLFFTCGGSSPAEIIGDHILVSATTIGDNP